MKQHHGCCEKTVLLVLSQLHQCIMQKFCLKTAEISVNSKQPQRRFVTHRRNLFLIAIYCSVIITEGCDQVTTLSAKQTTCFLTANSSSCAFDETTLISLIPGTEACLKLQSYENTTMGTVRLKVTSVRSLCDKKVEYYTREHKFKVSSKKLCFREGSCSWGRCARIKPHEKVPELGKEANGSPGYTLCGESCGCWGCGCFYCVEACLFYRVYAIPTTRTVYEIFSCTKWKMQAHVTASVTTEKGTQKFDFTLIPGELKKEQNISLSLLADSLPPIKFFHDTFITDQKRTAVIPSSAAGQALPGTIGQLQCASSSIATNFSGCTFPLSNCHCDTANRRASCHCSEISLENVLKSSEKRLPLYSEGYTLQYSDHKLFADIQKIGSIQMQLVFRQFKLATTVEQNICMISHASLSGCYSCTQAAQLKYRCQTNFGKAMARIQCGNSTAIAPCESKERWYEERIVFSQAYISQNCTATCPGGVTTFNVTGILSFMKPENVSGTGMGSGDGSQGGSGISAFFKSVAKGIGNAISAIISFFKNLWWFIKVCVVIAIILILLLLAFYLRKLFLKLKSSNRNPVHEKAESHLLMAKLDAGIDHEKEY